jgi:glycosyltransferase involved in cell wall biosynthesis
MTNGLARAGVVAIGRNEGERLRKCFDSIPKGIGAVVYVDSGSSDGSIELARSRGHTVVALDMNRPFTAARARNAGFERLVSTAPRIEYVQFVDGDCAIAPGWLELAAATLAEQPGVTAVWGRRRELHPEHSAYNRVCDVEWSQERPGETQVFGGDVMVRTRAVRELGGYNARIIAGEDPEFAYRLHKRGHRIVRLDAEMTVHDAAITKFRQWWARTKRSGYAYAQVSALHRKEPEKFWVKDSRRALMWGFIVPALVPALAVPTLGLSSLLLGTYPVRFRRIAQKAEKDGLLREDARYWAMHCVGASFPQAIGILSYHWQKLRGQIPELIEYK